MKCLNWVVQLTSFEDYLDHKNQIKHFVSFLCISVRLKLAYSKPRTYPQQLENKWRMIRIVMIDKWIHYYSNKLKHMIKKKCWKVTCSGVCEICGFICFATKCLSLTRVHSGRTPERKTCSHEKVITQPWTDSFADLYNLLRWREIWAKKSTNKDWQGREDNSGSAFIVSGCQ